MVITNMGINRPAGHIVVRIYIQWLYSITSLNKYWLTMAISIEMNEMKVANFKIRKHIYGAKVDEQSISDQQNSHPATLFCLVCFFNRVFVNVSLSFNEVISFFSSFSLASCWPSFLDLFVLHIFVAILAIATI